MTVTLMNKKKISLSKVSSEACSIRTMARWEDKKKGIQKFGCNIESSEKDHFFKSFFQSMQHSQHGTVGGW